MGKSYWITWILISAAATFFMAPVGLIVIIVSLVIIPAICNHYNKKDYAEWVAYEVEQELDEIEAELNAMTSDEKITPIWEIPNKKK